MMVAYKSQTAKLPLLVVNSKGPNLLGRNWLQVIKDRLGGDPQCAVE